jgi:hypothetical protein
MDVKLNSQSATSDRKYVLSIDPTTQVRKPERSEIGRISNRISMYTGLTIQELFTHVTAPYSYTWSGAIFSGKRSNDNWQQQSVFALDFDKGLISLSDVIDKLRDNGVEPQCWYSTLGSSPALHKFRVIIAIDEPITNLDDRYVVIMGLLYLFPEADTNCKDASRIFLGGRDGVVLSNTPNGKAELLDRMGVIVVANDDMRVRHIKRAPFANEVEKGGEICNSLYSSNRNLQNSPNNNENIRRPEKGTIIDIDKAREHVKILDMFLNGKWLGHDELFGLATNLIYVRGGEKLMKETMEKYNNEGLTNYTPNNFAIIPYVKKRNYYPMALKGYSPYAQDHEYFDLISAVNNRRGKVEVLENKTPKSRYEAEQYLSDTLERIANMDGNCIHIIKVPTALGKTESILKYNAAIAAPTNALKRELSSRMKALHLITPDELEFSNNEVNQRIATYYSLGLHSKAQSIIHEIAKGKYQLSTTPEDKINAETFLSIVKECRSSNKTILTTHARVLNTNFEHGTIIIDEDPLEHLMSIKQISISELHRIKNHKGFFGKDLNLLISFLEGCQQGEIVPTPILDIDVENLIDEIALAADVTSNIMEFFNSSFLIRDKYDGDLVSYIVKRELPKDKKIVILSATIPNYIYQELYGDRVKIYDIGLVEQQGRIIQYTNRSCSRLQLKSYINSIKQSVGEKLTLTFKEYQSHFSNPIKEMYFGNCAGYDTVKGQDIAVVGTPHRNNVQYLLTAKCLGIDFKTSDTTFTCQEVVHNGIKFQFNTYQHEGLRSIQMSLIESDLVQAVGRARTLRTDATVELYSNFPLRISTEFRY